MAKRFRSRHARMIPVDPNITARTEITEFISPKNRSSINPWLSIQEVALDQIFPIAAAPISTQTPYIDHYAVLVPFDQEQGISRQVELMTRCHFRREHMLRSTANVAILQKVKFELELPDFKHTLICNFGTELDPASAALVSEFGDLSTYEFNPDLTTIV